MKIHKVHTMMLVVVLMMATIVSGQGNHPNKNLNDYRYQNSYPNARYHGKNDKVGKKYRNNRNMVVARPPVARQVFKARQPSKSHIWMPNEYVWRSGRYVNVPGYWMMPPRKGHRYVTGFWQPTYGGYTWVAGYWTNGWRNQRWY